MNPDLLAWLAACNKDPKAFVLGAFPWGEPGTTLEHHTGPEAWQEQVLSDVANGLLDLAQAIRIAVASGHGIGKSALAAWLILWAFTTAPDTLGVVTANTETQLKTKTWASVGKWFNLFIGREHFTLTATALLSKDPSRERTWRIDMVPWSEKNTEAFAGLHNLGKRLLLLMDEASAIPDVIHEVSEGALTDKGTEIIWCMFGNPTKNTGRFREAFSGGKFAALWRTYQVDSREVSFTNKDQIAQWIESYGVDSDFVRIRVRGVFPRAGSIQFIDSERTVEASKRELPVHNSDALVVGVDVARFGDDASVIYFRKGRDGRSLAPLVYRGIDTMTLAGHVSSIYAQYKPDAIFVDGGGVGGGVVDRLRQLSVPHFEIQFGSKADGAWAAEGVAYANKRAEMWGALREWLKIGSIVESKDLISDLTGPEYGFNAQNKILLEKKEDMKKRGLASPDLGDALALTFAYPVQPKALPVERGDALVITDYDPFEYRRMDAA